LFSMFGGVSLTKIPGRRGMFRPGPHDLTSTARITSALIPNRYATITAQSDINDGDFKYALTVFLRPSTDLWFRLFRIEPLSISKSRSSTLRSTDEAHLLLPNPLTRRRAHNRRWSITGAARVGHSGAPDSNPKCAKRSAY
jgi:hypothetical protein